MKVKFWGTRGSIPTPLKPLEVRAKIRHAILGLPSLDTRDEAAVDAYLDQLPPLVSGTAGGNTPCVEIRSGEELIVADAGSGLRELGQELLRGAFGRGQGTLHLFISHLHWDHIQGFTMFTPAFIRGNRIFIYSFHDVRTALEMQLTPPTWPVGLEYMSAQIEFIRLKEDTPIYLGPVRVDAFKNNHPGDSYNYRFTDSHSSLVYATDVEYKHLQDASALACIAFFRNADALIFDAQYTLREAWDKVDWGHSSAMIGVDVARAARVKKLMLFHHDPTYSDAELQSILETALAYRDQSPGQPPYEIQVAYEGLALDLTPERAVSAQLAADGETTILNPARVFDELSVGQLAEQLAGRAGAGSSPVVDLSQVETLTTAGLKALVALQQTAPIVLAAPSARIRQVISLGGYQDAFVIYPSVEAALAAVRAREAVQLPGQVIDGRYQIQARLGESSLGTVLQVLDIQTQRVFALKLLYPAFNPQTMERLAQQSKQIIAMEHVNIVRVFAWENRAAFSYELEELVPVPTLEDVLAKSRNPFSSDEALKIVVDVSRALEYAHSRGVIHGDLKPANIFLTPQGAKISGFGLGRLSEGRNLLETPLLFLSAPYLAPEQILGQPDARSDLYALGVILYRMLTGQLPFSGDSLTVLGANLRTAPELPSLLNPRISPTLEHMVLKLLAKNPNDRYASPQQAWHVSSSMVFWTQEGSPASRLRLVGRQHFLDALLDSWRKAHGGHGQLVFITGELGIGKTALAQQIAAQSEASVVLRGYADDRDDNPPYHLFIQILRDYFDTVPPEFFDAQAKQLIGDFARLVPEVRQILPDLPTPAALEPAQEQLRLMGSLARFAQQATRERPWLMILDGLQWADRGSLEVLRYLGRHLPELSLLIIGVYRDSDLPSNHPLWQMLRALSHHPTYRQLALERLDLAGVSELLQETWQQPVPPDLTAKIYQHTAGNPFYVIEVAKSLMDEGHVFLQAGQWQFPNLQTISLPSSVRETILRRVALLTPDTQNLLRQAAVLGQVFSLADLLEMSGLSEWEALEHLDVALERQLVQEAPGDGVLGFTQAEIQLALYEDLGHMRRRMLHRQAAEAMERRAQPQPDRIAESLAFHFGKAGELEKTLRYSLAAAHQAQVVYANEEALQWYRQAMEVLKQLGSEPYQAQQMDAHKMDAHKCLCQVLTLVGRYDEALEQCALAQASLEARPMSPEQSRQLADLCRQTAQVHEQRGRYDLALDWLQCALAHLDKTKPTLELMQVHNLFGMVYLRRGEHQAARNYLESVLRLAHANGAGALPPIATLAVKADSLRTLGTVARAAGAFDEALAFAQQALELYRQIGDRPGEVRAMNLLASTNASWGEYSQSREYYEQTLNICREIGDRRNEGIVINNLGSIASDLHEYTAAINYYRQSLDIGVEIGDKLGEAIALMNLGDIHGRLGAFDQARAFYEQPPLIFHDIGDRPNESLALAELGRLHHSLGDHEAACHYCEQSLALAQELDIPVAQSKALTNLGHALAALARLDEAAAAYQQALSLRRELEQPGMALEPLAGLAQVSLAQSSPRQALAYTEEILAHAQFGTLEGTEEPLRILWTCYQALRANKDKRAETVLIAAHRLLQEQANKIAGDDLRQSFLTNVPFHHLVVAEFGQRERID